jgi:hypothetical protein
MVRAGASSLSSFDMIIVVRILAVSSPGPLMMKGWRKMRKQVVLYLFYSNKLKHRIFTLTLAISPCFFVALPASYRASAQTYQSLSTLLCDLYYYRLIHRPEYRLRLDLALQTKSNKGVSRWDGGMSGLVVRKAPRATKDGRYEE